MPFELSPSSSPAIARMKEALSKLETEKGRMAGVSFKPGPEDVLIVTPPKCGTTWVCQIVHSLRSGGDMSFEEINLAIPCLEMGYDYGYRDLSRPQPAAPRAYKTHLWQRDCPKGAGRYIYVVRDPMAAGPSFFKFLQGWFFDAGEVSMEEFLLEFWLARGAPPTPMQNASHWHNMASWYPRRSDPGVLWLHYEDLQQDVAACIALIARHLGLGADDPKLQALAAEQSDIKFMALHPSKYDEHMLKLARNEACGRPLRAGLDGSSSGKVNSSRALEGGRREELTQALRRAILEKWEEVMLPATGYASYEEMRQGINSELGRPFGRQQQGR